MLDISQTSDISRPCSSSSPCRGGDCSQRWCPSTPWSVPLRRQGEINEKWSEKWGVNSNGIEVCLKRVWSEIFVFFVIYIYIYLIWGYHIASIGNWCKCWLIGSNYARFLSYEKQTYGTSDTCWLIGERNSFNVGVLFLKERVFLCLPDQLGLV